MQILIADDETVLRKLLCDFLKKDGYETIDVENGREAVQAFSSHSVSLVILDVMMPEMNGYDACKEIKRKNPDVPVLILTAKDAEEDQIIAFQSGADDYISKPFSMPIFLLRVKALLKRQVITEDIMELQNVKINLLKHEVYLKGTLIDLTPKEFELLVYLVKNKNVVVSRDMILENVWDYDFIGDNRTVDTHIKNLRLKLDDDGTFIKTIRGYGYGVTTC